MSGYFSTLTGRPLVRKDRMFYWRGRYFSGLVDEQLGALYDDPEDSFAEAVGIQPSLEAGLVSKLADSHEGGRTE